MFLILLFPYHSHIQNIPLAALLIFPFLGSGVRVEDGLCTWEYSLPLASWGSPEPSSSSCIQLRIPGIEAYERKGRHGLRSYCNKLAHRWWILEPGKFRRDGLVFFWTIMLSDSEPSSASFQLGCKDRSCILHNLPFGVKYFSALLSLLEGEEHHFSGNCLCLQNPKPPWVLLTASAC